MEEVEYLRSPGALVTSTRIELDGQTFAVRNIGSVKVTKPGTPWIAALILIGSLFIALNAGRDAVGALVISLICAIWIWQQLTMRRLVLVSGGGETVALKSRNGAFIESIRAAIAQAISSR